MPAQFFRCCVVVLAFLCGSQHALAAAQVEKLKLDNGLTVYLTPTDSASGMVDLRLIVDWGAADEAVGQRGWAHLLEHLAFAGTDSFSANDIRGMYTHAGLRLGADVNASTGDRFTSYQLTAAAEDADALDKNMRLMSEWLTGMRFNANDLVREKRIIAAEAIATQQRNQYVHWQDKLLQQSGDTLGAIGLMQDVRAAELQPLREFWRKGYRTDNAVVLVTGHFDAKTLREQVKRVFATVPRSADSKPKDVLNTSPDALSRVSISPLPVGEETRVALAGLAVGKSQVELIRSAFTAVQLQLLRSQDDMHCSSVRLGSVVVSEQTTLFYIEQSVESGSYMHCFQAMVDAVRMVREASEESDFTVDLFHQLQTKRQTAHRAESLVSASALADQLQERVLGGGTPITPADAIAGTTNWLAGQDLQRFGPQLQEVLSSDRLSLVLRTPNAAQVDPETILSVWNKTSKPLPDAPVRLHIASPEPKSPIKESVLDDGLVSLQYANGAQVHLLRTEASNQQIDVLVMREGGLTSVPENLVAAAVQIPRLLPKQQAFASAYSQAAVREQSVDINWFVGSFNQGMRAKARTSEAPSLLSMLHQANTQGPFEQAIDGQVLEAAQSVADTYQGVRQLRSSIWSALYGFPKHNIGTVDGVLNADQLARTHRLLFEGTDGLHVYIAGDFDSEQMRALSDQYIGSLVSSADSRSVERVRAAAKRRRIVHRGNQVERADLSFYYIQSADNKLDTHDAELLLLREVLAERLWSVLREQEGLTYDVHLDLQRRAYSRGGSALKVGLVCDPALTTEIRRHVDAVFLSFVRDGVSEQELSPLRIRLAREFDRSLADNGLLLQEWANQHRRGRSLQQVLNTADAIQSVEPEELVQFARRFFSETGFLEVNIMPGLHAQADTGREAAFVSSTR